MTTAAGATGVVLASGLWMPGRALADNAAPKPIPGDFQPFGPGTEVFHIDALSPGLTENSTIFDFHGSIGAAIVDGTGIGTNTDTGTTSSLLFDTDMRFMQGIYIGLDGQKHTGTFILIWLDLYEGQVAPPNQIHDFNPGIAHSGLFWTIRAPHESVEVDLDDATASMKLSDVEIEDYHDLVNALKDGPSVPADVSFHMHWSGVQQRVHLHDEQKKFDAHLIVDKATLAWSARTKHFKFVSAPENTSTTVFATIGSERNGVFFS
jgi:hypothetical protein